MGFVYFMNKGNILYVYRIWNIIINMNVYIYLWFYRNEIVCFGVFCVFMFGVIFEFIIF